MYVRAIDVVLGDISRVKAVVVCSSRHVELRTVPIFNQYALVSHIDVVSDTYFAWKVMFFGFGLRRSSLVYA